MVKLDTLPVVRVQANGAELCVEALGERGDPPILLIMGSGGSMEWWDDEFCERLAAGGRFVVRYDHRDTGESTTYPPGSPQYTGTDLIDDAVAVLDGLGLERAHVAGLSMGGALAQVLALDHPERVASLCLIATSPAGPDKDLPGMAADDAARLNAIPAPDWSDREAVIDARGTAEMTPRVWGCELAAAISLATSFSPTGPRSVDTSPAGLVTKSTAPAASASKVSRAPSRVCADSITTGVGRCRMISRTAATPSRIGML